MLIPFRPLHRGEESAKDLMKLPGRTKEQKRAAIEGITEKLHEVLSIPKEDVFIIINEPPFENWGLGGNQK